MSANTTKRPACAWPAIGATRPATHIVNTRNGSTFFIASYLTDDLPSHVAG
jgi:hypothetical protein